MRCLITMQKAHLPHWPVGVLEVWLQEGIEETASDALNSVINGEHMNALAILDICTLRHHNLDIR